tara:strand:+ start:50 stop:346 length:297 start_codon:yes stop_codon:yes gene_type:complete
VYSHLIVLLSLFAALAGLSPGFVGKVFAWPTAQRDRALEVIPPISAVLADHQATLAFAALAILGPGFDVSAVLVKALPVIQRHLYLASITVRTILICV